MARISDITLKEQPQYHSATIRRTIHFMEEFAAFTANSFSQITSYLNKANVLVSDGPIVCFHNMDLERLDVEVGFPIARRIDGNVDVKVNTVPIQKIVAAIDMGAYEQQDATLGELFTYIQAHAYQPLGKIYYQYLNDTNRPANEFLTKMMIPIL